MNLYRGIALFFTSFRNLHLLPNDGVLFHNKTDLNKPIVLKYIESEEILRNILFTII